VDAERRIIRERCDALKEEVLSDLTAWEAKEADRIKGHEDALAAMMDLFGLLPADPTSQQVRESMDKLDAHQDGREWQEFAQRAHDLHTEVGLKLTAALADAVAREEAAAEAERLRLEAEEAARVEAARVQREREARIAAEAAEAARAAAEARAAEAAAMERQRVERERLDAEDARREAEIAAQAEIEAMEAQNRLAQERARQAEERAAAAAVKAEADRVAAAAKAERDRIAAIEAERARIAAEKATEEKAAAERAKNLEIKRKVNFDAAAALVVKAGLTEQQAQRVVIAIAKREIPMVEIRY
jgi:colicin import membrane protein